MTSEYCWKCKKFVVVVDADKQREFSEMYSIGVEKTKKYREQTGVPLKDVPFRELFQSLYAFYESLGGDTSSGHEEFRNHLRGHFGPECFGCGKNFRMPKASFCAECGWRPKTLLRN